MAENTLTRTDRQASAAETLLSFHIEQGDEVVLQVKGWSMGLVLAPYRDVLVRPLRRPPFFGDVVLLRNDSHFIVHRVIGRVSGGRGLTVTKGDNCRQSDPPVAGTDIVGLVVGIKEPEGLCIPWHWRFPLSCFIALLSHMEARGVRFATHLLQNTLYLSWRAQEKWNRFKRRRLTKRG